MGRPWLRGARAHVRCVGRGAACKARDLPSSGCMPRPQWPLLQAHKPNGSTACPTDLEFGRIQARDLLQHLWTGPISNAPVEIIQGGKSVEVGEKGCHVQ